MEKKNNRRKPPNTSSYFTSFTSTTSSLTPQSFKMVILSPCETTFGIYFLETLKNKLFRIFRIKFSKKNF